jgi:hypothetical protein
MSFYQIKVYSDKWRGAKIIMARKKSGPSKKDGVVRSASGRISRAIDAVKAREDLEIDRAVKNRMKLWGLNEKQARSQMAGYPIGVLCLNWSTSPNANNSNAIDVRQHDALVGLWELHARYLKAIDSPSTIASPGFEMVSRGMPIIADIDDENEITRTNKIRARYADVRRVVSDCIGLVGWSRVIEIACRQNPVIHNADVAFLRMAANEINRLWNDRNRLAA